MYINIHSHHRGTENQFVIQNLVNLFEENQETGYYSVGLHPWHLDASTWQQHFTQLKKISKARNVVAIGECGLDRICSTDYNLQKEVFLAQLLWANEIKKPLIIHCVRAYEDLLQLITKYNNKVPVIFHGFNKNMLLAKKILDAGHWISFGKALMYAQLSEVFYSIPSDRYFLETDDSAISIEQVYKTATAIKNISSDTLDLQLRKNVEKVFNIKL